MAPSHEVPHIHVPYAQEDDSLEPQAHCDANKELGGLLFHWYEIPCPTFDVQNQQRPEVMQALAFIHDFCKRLGIGWCCFPRQKWSKAQKGR